MARILAVALNPAIDISCDAENVQPTHKIRTFNEKHYAGGGGTNVARVIAELGGTPELLFLSGGATGALLEDFLEKLPIRRHRIMVSCSVRVAFMVHEMQTGFEYRFVPEGSEVRPEELTPIFDFLEKCDADYIVASGSLPRGVPSNTYARMADFAVRKGARFILDTSGEALTTALSKSNVFLVKPSLGELERHVGERLDEDGARKAAVDLVRRGSAQHVAVTMGMEGALLASADGVLRVPSRHVTVRSAVGAGDSFVGAMVFALAEGKPIEDAFRLGVAAGAAAVMTSGTELCRREDVLALYQVDITDWKTGPD
jgi:6-phosphofructokinase 2